MGEIINTIDFNIDSKEEIKILNIPDLNNSKKLDTKNL
jgi:hypothetical protein